MASSKGLDAAIVDFVVEYTADRGYPPTVREISGTTGASLGGVHRALVRLAEEGRISYEPGSSRTLRVLNG